MSERPQGLSPEREPDQSDDAATPPPRMHPFIHAALYSLGVGVVLQSGLILFSGMLLRSRLGPVEALASPSDPEALQQLLAGLNLHDNLLILAAAQGLGVMYTISLWRLLRGRRVTSLGLPEGPAGPQGLAVGALQGAALVGGVVALALGSGAVRFAGLAADPTLLSAGGGAAGIALVMLLVSAFSEEVFFRGYMMRILLEGTSVVAALTTTTLLFGAFHGFNPSAGPLGLAGTALAGLLLALVALRDGHLWRAIGIHFGWNTALGFLCSFPVSGIPIQGFIDWTIDEGRWATWMGGDFGPEGGIAGVATLCVAVALAGRQLIRDGVAPLDLDPPAEPRSES